MGFAFYALVLASVALFGMLARELVRPLISRHRARRLERRLKSDIEARTEAALDLPGATPERAVEVTSASVVEVRAAREPCPVCGERVHVERHAAQPFGERTLRVVSLHCRRCGHRRPFYAHVAPPVLH